MTQFHTARLGVRFLMEQHHTARGTSPDGFSGIIRTKLGAVDVAQTAANDATRLCTRFMGVSPRVDIVCTDGSPVITHSPAHIHYVLMELLKNSLRAVVEKEGSKSLSFFSPTLYSTKRQNQLPPVTVRTRTTTATTAVAAHADRSLLALTPSHTHAHTPPYY